MDKNYYDWLEVNRNASSEIIEKAYKTLVKKYHPDLQEADQKLECQEKIKIINEAYEILSNSEKRKEYDSTLIENEPTQEELDQLYCENQNLKNELNNLINHMSSHNKIEEHSTKTKINSNSNQETMINNQYKNDYQQAIQKAYHEAYIQDLKNRGYKIKYKKTWKDYFHGLIGILGVILFLSILWQIPFIKNYCIELYQTNSFIKLLVDTVFSLFQ